MGHIKKNFLYSGILTTSNYIFPLLTFPYISRVLGVYNVGVCNFVDSIINYYILFSMMGISVVGIREIARCKDDKAELDRTFSSLFLLNTISTTIVLIALILSIYLVPKFHEHKDLLFIGAAKLFFNYLAIEWCYKGLEEFKYITNRTLIVKSIYVLSVFLFVRDKNDYTIYYMLLAGMTVVNAIINFTYIRKFISLSFRHVSLRIYVKPFMTLGLYMMLTSMYTSFNIAYLGFVAGETQVGYYTTATKLHSILLALFTAFTGVLLPRMSYLIAENRMDEFRKILRKSIDILLAFSIPTILLATIMAPEIIRIIAGVGYEGAILPMRIVMPLIAIIGYEQILIIQTLTPLKEDRIILRNSILGATTGIVMNVLLVSQFQSIGSSIVWVISEMVVLLSAQTYLSKHWQICFPYGIVVRNIVFYIPLFFILFWIVCTDCFSTLVLLVCGCLITLLYSLILQIAILKNETIYSLWNNVINIIIKNRRK